MYEPKLPITSAAEVKAISREDFTYDHAADVYHCPGGKVLTTTGALVNDNATCFTSPASAIAIDAH